MGEPAPGVEHPQFVGVELVLDQEGSFVDPPQGLPDAQAGQQGLLGAGEAEGLGGGADLVGLLAVDDAAFGVGEQARGVSDRLSQILAIRDEESLRPTRSMTADAPDSIANSLPCFAFICARWPSLDPSSCIALGGRRSPLSEVAPSMLRCKWCINGWTRGSQRSS